MRWLLVGAWLVPVISIASELAGSDPASVIFLSKNTNSNQVHYGVHLDEQCRPQGQSPVYVYWQMHEVGPDVTEGLMLWERPGYGVRQPRTIERTEIGGSFSFTIRGVPDQEIRLEAFMTPDGCRARALTRIAQQEAIFQRIEIAVSGWANIHRVEIFGVAVDSSDPVSEITHED